VLEAKQTEKLLASQAVIDNRRVPLMVSMFSISKRFLPVSCSREMANGWMD
jgi:hypothetical protein